ncbi:MAG TPA: hypothetical protein VFB00_05705 [Terriglobales bacterium]|nr:hypothetical protein [Terriglobales bacterium]
MTYSCALKADESSMTPAIPTDPNSIWANLRKLYPIYCAMASELAIEVRPCAELVEALDVPPAEALAAAEKWFRELEEKIQAYHLRQFSQTSAQMNEDVLRELLVRQLSKRSRNPQDRDKADFLLVQYFSLRVPPELSNADLSLKAVAKQLEPVIGKCDIAAPQFLKPLNDLLQEADRTASLKAFFTSRIIERGRELKTACGERFFEPLSMAALTRFGFLVRRTFFRLMQHDLNIILDGLRRLEARGVTTLDCRKAQFGAEEPISRLRMICQSWKVMFHAEYSSGQPLCILVDLRTAVEAALAGSAKPGATPARPRTTAASAAAGASSRNPQEFEVSGPSPWDPDAENHK